MVVFAGESGLGTPGAVFFTARWSTPAGFGRKGQGGHPNGRRQRTSFFQRCAHTCSASRKGESNPIRRRRGTGSPRLRRSAVHNRRELGTRPDEPAPFVRARAIRTTSSSGRAVRTDRRPHKDSRRDSPSKRTRRIAPSASLFGDDRSSRSSRPSRRIDPVNPRRQFGSRIPVIEVSPRIVAVSATAATVSA